MINYISKGIHTIEIYQRSMSYDKLQTIVDDLYKYQKETGKKVIVKPWQSDNGINRRYRVLEGIVPDGITMIIEQMSPMGGIRFIVNPSTLYNADYDPLVLYKPGKHSDLIQDAVDAIERVFTDSKNLGLFEHGDWHFDKEFVSLSRIDLTWNLHFDEKTDLTEVIRLFYHADIEKYNLITFEDNEQNKHSFTISKGPITFTAYDKNHEVENHKNICNKYEDCILRIEIKIERDGFKSKFNLEKKVNKYTFDELLRYAYKSRNDILRNYLDKLFPGTGEHLPYQKADTIIQKDAKPKYKDAMLYLIKETSRLKNYTRAKEETMKKHKLGKQKYQYLLDEFNRINISPITMKKDAKTKCIECFKKLDF